MISFRCSNCGGEMSVAPTGDLLCSYCGSKQVFSDKELRDYRDFRRRMLAYLSALSDVAVPEETERIWTRAETVSFRASDGRPISAQYLFSGEQDGVTIYTARKNALFVFPAESSGMVSRFTSMPGKLRYPAADIKGLPSYFPVVSGVFDLDDGRTLVSVSKQEECFPLSAFGSLRAEYTAWIISRLENLCCVLAYSDLAHRGIGLESVFINARTHEAFLLGGWWNAEPCANGARQDLTDLRRAAKRLTGMWYTDAPEAFRRFAEGTPAGDAYDDFTLWDSVIMKAFGGRQFRKMDLSELKM